MNQNLINTASKRVFDHLQNGESLKDAYIRSIPVIGLGYILPVGKSYLVNKDISRYLLENEKLIFSLQSPDENGKRSIVEIFSNLEGRALFMVVNLSGNIIGHILASYNDSSDALNIFSYSLKSEKKINTLLISFFRYFKQLLPINLCTLMVTNADDVSLLQEIGFKKADGVVGKKLNNEGLYSEILEWEDSAQTGEGLILTAGPSISSKELSYTYDAAENGWNLQHSSYIDRFETYFANYLGVKYAIATSSCTGALQIALMALEIGPGDEVIVPDMTWVATANAVKYVGAKPIFADIEYDKWTLDAGAVERLITNKTKAIIPAHLYGHPANMTQLLKISKKYNLHLIEDAAPAIGAEWEGKKCGTFGSFSAFSFQGAKLLVTGEGGMLVTDDESLYKKALKIWDQGRNPEKQFWIDGNGVKFKMSNMQAAFGLAQIERVDEQIQMKRRIFSWYQELLGEIKNITLNTEPALGKSIYWMTSITINEGSGIERGELIKYLKNNNIDSRIVFPPISQYPIWGSAVTPGVNAENVSLRGINLPSGVGRNKSEIQYIASTILKFISKNYS